MEPFQPTVIDPYFGLLSKPPGQWSIVRYGNTNAVLLQGSDKFLTHNYNLLSSYGGGKNIGDHHNIDIKYHVIYDDTWMVPISESRLIRALETYFYCHYYMISRKNDLPVEENRLNINAHSLALQFIEHGMDRRLDYDVENTGGSLSTYKVSER